MVSEGVKASGRYRKPVAAAAVLLLVALLLFVLFGVNNGRGAEASCKPGAKPTLDLPRVLPGSGVKLHGDPVVVGCGAFKDYGRVEIVAYSTSEGVCYAVDSVTPGSSEGGRCVDSKESWQALCGKALCAHAAFGGHEGRNESPITRVIGEASPRVVQIVAAEKGKKAVNGVIARFTRNVREKLGGLSDPPVLFAVVLRGCPSASGVALKGWDDEKQLVGQVKASRISGACF